MADNRLILRCGDDEIVLAVRNGDEWRSAMEDRNDLGDFIDKMNEQCLFDCIFELDLQHQAEFTDPLIVLGDYLGGERCKINGRCHCMNDD
jgi:hypothetical protein